jgi:hypothetical protein
VALAIIPAIVIAPLAATARALHELWADDKTRSIVTAAAWLLVAGTVVFMIVEDLSLIDGFYFSFITLATIGYGDIAPATDLGKIIAVLYGISGLGVIASLVAAIARRPRSERRERRAARGPGATG